MTYHLIIDYTIGEWGYSKQYVRKLLSDYKGKHVDVKISSLGGDLDHGLDIRQQFLDHGDVTVYLSGFVASAATVIAMGAKRIVMSKYAMFLVHKCSNFIDAWGTYNADQMQQLIDQLETNKKENDKIDVVLANMYAAKCGKKVSDILDILKEGRWLSAQEALDYGFIDAISDLDGDQKINFTPELQSKFNAIGLSTAGLGIATAPPEQPQKSLLGKIVETIFPQKGNESTDKNTLSTNVMSSKMKIYKFSAVNTLLKFDTGLTPDKDGDVTVSAEQMESINNHIETLSSEVAAKDKTIADNAKEILDLKAQVNNLLNGPGAETTEIEDLGGKANVTSTSMYNDIKEFL